jgi:putative aldouronate transport system substrate-binding protein
MKKGKITRVFAALLAFVMLTSLTACTGGSETSSDSSGSTSSASEMEVAENDGPLTPYEEPITITWAVQASPVQQFIDGDTYDDNVWSRLIKEKLNINLEVAFSADTSTDAYKQKMNVLLASGDFPDVIRWSDRTFFKQAQEAGFIQPIGPAFDAYATDEVKAYQEKYPEAFEGGTIDGTLYAFPYMNDNFHQAYNLWIRDDWLENTNTTPPTTVEEMVELARIFTEEDPDGNGVDDTYGFALSGTVTQNNYATLTGLANAYGVPGFDSTGTFFRKDDGELTFAWIQPEMKEVLSIVHDMYEKGYINPEFTADDVATMEDDVTNGTIGMMYGPCWGTWHPFNYSYQASGVITRPYPIPTAEGYEPKIGTQSEKTGDLFMIGANCEHPEAIVKILNLYEQVAISSDDPNDFQTYWANEQYRLCPAYIGIPTELFAPDVHAALEAGSSDGLTGTALEYYNYVVGFEDGSLADDTNAYGTWGQMYLDGQGGSMKIDLDYKEKGWTVTNVMEDRQPDIWLQNSSVLGDMVNTTFVDIIVGNQPVEYFDTFVQNWLNAGGQETLDALEEMYPAE